MYARKSMLEEKVTVPQSVQCTTLTWEGILHTMVPQCAVHEYSVALSYHKMESLVPGVAAVWGEAPQHTCTVDVS